MVYTDCRIAGRILRMAAILALLSLSPPQEAYGHAGHGDIPEADLEEVGEVEPRFVSRNEDYEAILVVPEGGVPARLTLLDRNTNLPVAGAQVRVEVLEGTAPGDLTVSDGGFGTYTVEGLGQPLTTHTLLIDFDGAGHTGLMTLDEVLVEPMAAAVEDEHGRHESSGRLLYFLAALAALLAGFCLTVLMQIRREMRAARTGAAVLLLAALGLFSPGRMQAHEGDDHSGLIFTGLSVLPPDARFFVAVETQVGGGIETTRATVRAEPPVLRAFGRIEVRHDRRAVVTPPGDGKLLPPPGSEIPVIGQRVAAGDILLVIDQVIPAGDKVTLAAEEAQRIPELRAAEEEAEVARLDMERATQLRGVLSAQEIERAVANDRIARERVEGQRQRLATIRSALAGTGTAAVREVPVRAPLDGVITETHATRGEYVSADKALFSIVDTSALLVHADIFESDLGAVTGARRARVTAEAYPGRVFEAELHSVGEEVETGTRTVPVRFSLENPGGLLKGGMFVTAQIATGEPQSLIAVPRSAVFSQDGMQFVFRKIAPELFESRAVVVESFRGDEVHLKSGLDEGDQVAMRGLYQIRMSPRLRGTTR